MLAWVIGGASGAMPPVLGWAAIRGDVGPEALIMCLIIFLWTPPHFWALALYRAEDYRKSGLPMLPITHGSEFTRLHLLLYTLVLFAGIIVFSLFWMALPKLSLPVPDPGSEAPPSSAADLAAQAMPELAAQSYRLCDKGGRVAVYRCGTNGQPDVLVTVTGIYTNLLPENDAVRIKRGVTVYSERELDLLLEDLGD